MATIEEIKQRRSTITHSRWRVGTDDDNGLIILSDDYSQTVAFINDGVESAEGDIENAEFIANAPEDIDTLLYEIAQRDVILASLRAEIDSRDEKPSPLIRRARKINNR